MEVVGDDEGGGRLRLDDEQWREKEERKERKGGDW